MLYIHWKECNNTGIEIIDEQHRGIVSVINSYYHMVRSGKSRDALILTKGTLDEMTLIHFDTEEELMRRADYYAFKKHRSQHMALIANMNDMFQRSMKENDPNVFLSFLKQWWIAHINSEDQQYIENVKRIL